jgi:hypothetical protein
MKQRWRTRKKWKPVTVEEMRAILKRIGGDEVKIPEAISILKKVPGGWLWIVPVCPLCGQKHQHGGGSLKDNPRSFLGFRSAHCLKDIEPGQYLLVEKK